MGKDLLVSLPSRGSPEKLQESVDMLYATCHSITNFDIQIIIDIDHKALYDNVIKSIKQKRDNVFVSYIHHQKDSWLNLIRAQNEIMQSGKYYFFMFLSDDLRGLTQKWDKAIVDKKKYYKDDLFCLYSQTVIWGRSPEISKSCYTEKDIDAMGYYEHTPVWTKEFGKYLYFMFKKPYNFKYGREVILAELLKQLAKLGYKRNVGSNFNYDTLVCDKLSNESFFPEYIKMQKNKFLLLKGIAYLMKEQIENGIKS